MIGAIQRAGAYILAVGVVGAMLFAASAVNGQTAPPVTQTVNLTSTSAAAPAAETCQQKFIKCRTAGTSEGACTGQWTICMQKCTNAKPGQCNKDAECQSHCTENASSSAGPGSCCSPLVGPIQKNSCPNKIDGVCRANDAKPSDPTQSAPKDWQGEGDTPQVQKPGDQPTDLSDPAAGQESSIGDDIQKAYQASCPSGDCSSTPGAQDQLPPEWEQYLEGATKNVQDQLKNFGNSPADIPADLNTDGSFGDLNRQFGELTNPTNLDVSELGPFWDSPSQLAESAANYWNDAFGGSTFAPSPWDDAFGGDFTASESGGWGETISGWWDSAASAAQEAWNNVSGLWSAAPPEVFTSPGLYGPFAPDVPTSEGFGPYPEGLEPPAPSTQVLQDIANLPPPSSALPSFLPEPIGADADFGPPSAFAFNPDVPLGSLGNTVGGLTTSPFDFGNPSPPVADISDSPAIQGPTPGADLSFEGLTADPPRDGQAYTVSYSTNDQGVVVTANLPAGDLPSGFMPENLNPELGGSAIRANAQEALNWEAGMLIASDSLIDQQQDLELMGEDIKAIDDKILSLSDSLIDQQQDYQLAGLDPRTADPAAQRQIQELLAQRDALYGPYKESLDAFTKEAGAFREKYMTASYDAFGNAYYGPQRTEWAKLADAMGDYAASTDTFYSAFGEDWSTSAAARQHEAALFRSAGYANDLFATRQTIEQTKQNASFSDRIWYELGASGPLSAVNALEARAASLGEQVRDNQAIAYGLEKFDQAGDHNAEWNLTQMFSNPSPTPEDLAEQRLTVNNLRALQDNEKAIASNEDWYDHLPESQKIDQRPRYESLQGIYAAKQEYLNGILDEHVGNAPKSLETQMLIDQIAKPGIMQRALDTVVGDFSAQAQKSLSSYNPLSWAKGVVESSFASAISHGAEFLGVPTTERALVQDTQTWGENMRDWIAAGVMAPLDAMVLPAAKIPAMSYSLAVREGFEGIGSSVAPSFNSTEFANSLGLDSAATRVARAHADSAASVYDSVLSQGGSPNQAYKAAADYVGENIARTPEIPESMRNSIGGAIDAKLAERGLPTGTWIDNVPAPTPRADVPTPAAGVDVPPSSAAVEVPRPSTGAVDVPPSATADVRPPSASAIDTPPASADAPTPAAGAADAPSPSVVPEKPSLGQRLADWWRSAPETVTPLPAAYVPEQQAGLLSRMGEAVNTTASNLIQATGLAQAASRAALISALTVTNPIAVVENFVAPPFTGITRTASDIVRSPTVGSAAVMPSSGVRDLSREINDLSAALGTRQKALTDMIVADSQARPPQMDMLIDEIESLTIKRNAGIAELNRTINAGRRTEYDPFGDVYLLPKFAYEAGVAQLRSGTLAGLRNEASEAASVADLARITTAVRAEIPDAPGVPLSNNADLIADQRNLVRYIDQRIAEQQEIVRIMQNAMNAESRASTPALGDVVRDLAQTIPASPSAVWQAMTPWERAARVYGAAESINDVWRARFAAVGREYQPPQIEVVNTNIDLIGESPGAYMRARSGIVVNLASPAFAQGSEELFAFVMAHEIAHYVQNELGIISAAERSVGSQVTYKLELQADYLAGTTLRDLGYDTEQLRAEAYGAGIDTTSVGRLIRADSTATTHPFAFERSSAVAAGLDGDWKAGLEMLASDGVRPPWSNVGAVEYTPVTSSAIDRAIQRFNPARQEALDGAITDPSAINRLFSDGASQSITSRILTNAPAASIGRGTTPSDVTRPGQGLFSGIRKVWNELSPFAIRDANAALPSGTSAAPSTLVARAKPLTGIASTYNPNVRGWRTGGQALATGGRYNPKAYEAALQLSLARQYGVGYGSRRTGYALVEAGDKQLIVKINDNGPLLGSRTKVGPRIIDLNEASMRYLSNNRLGNNNGLLQDVRVTLLQGQNYRAGPVVPGTQIADVSGRTRVVTPAAQTPSTQVAQNTPPLPVQKPQTRTIPLGQYLVERAVERVRSAAESVRQTLVDGAQGNRVSRDVFEEPGARGDRLIAEKAADLRERALTRVGRGAVGSETQAPVANAARTAPTTAQQRQMAKQVIADMGGTGALSKYYTYDAHGVVREYGTGRIVQGFRMQPVGSAANTKRLEKGYNIVDGKLLATHELIQRTLGVDTLTFNSGSRPVTIGSNRHHSWVKGPDGKRMLVSYAVDYTGGNANIKAAIATAASRSQWALNQEIAAATGRANAIPLSIGARYTNATNMVHVDTFPKAPARSWGSARVSNRLMQVYNTLRRSQRSGPTYVTQELFAESLAAARMGIVPGQAVAAAPPPLPVPNPQRTAGAVPAEVQVEVSIGKFPLTSRVADAIRDMIGKPTDAIAIRYSDPPDASLVAEAPRIPQAPALDTPPPDASFVPDAPRVAQPPAAAPEVPVAINDPAPPDTYLPTIPAETLERAAVRSLARGAWGVAQDIGSGVSRIAGRAVDVVQDIGNSAGRAWELAMNRLGSVADAPQPRAITESVPSAAPIADAPRVAPDPQDAARISTLQDNVTVAQGQGAAIDAINRDLATTRTLIVLVNEALETTSRGIATFSKPDEAGRAVIDRGVEAARQLPIVLQRIESTYPAAGIDAAGPETLPSEISRYGDMLSELERKEGFDLLNSARDAVTLGKELVEKTNDYIGTAQSAVDAGRVQATQRLAQAEDELTAAQRTPAQQVAQTPAQPSAPTVAVPQPAPAPDTVPALDPARPVISTQMDALIRQAVVQREQADSLAKMNDADAALQEKQLYAHTRQNLAETALKSYYNVTSIGDVPARTADDAMFVQLYRDIYAEAQAADRALSIELSRNTLARMQLENAMTPLSPPHSSEALAAQETRIAQSIAEFDRFHAAQTAEFDAYFRAFADAQSYRSVDQLRRVIAGSEADLADAYGGNWREIDLTDPALSLSDKQIIANQLLTRRMLEEIDAGRYTLRPTPVQEAGNFFTDAAIAASGSLARGVRDMMNRIADRLIPARNTIPSDAPVPMPRAVRPEDVLPSPAPESPAPSSDPVPPEPDAPVAMEPEATRAIVPVVTGTSVPISPSAQRMIAALADALRAPANAIGGPVSAAARGADAVADAALARRAASNAPEPRITPDGQYEMAFGSDLGTAPRTAASPEPRPQASDGKQLEFDFSKPSLISRAWKTCATWWKTCLVVGGIAGYNLWHLADVTITELPSDTPSQSAPGTGSAPPAQSPPAGEQPPGKSGAAGAPDPSAPVPRGWRVVTPGAATPGLGNLNGLGTLGGLAQILQALGSMGAGQQQPQPQQTLQPQAPYAPSPTPIGPTQSQNPQNPQNPMQPTPSEPLPSISVTANPNSIAAGESSTLRWISFRSSACEIRSGGSLIASVSTQGERATGALSRTTAFVVSCSGTGGVRHATSTVYVDEEAPQSASTQLSEPAPTIQATSGTGGASSYAPMQTSSSGSNANCDPARPVDEFIACLQALPGSANPIQ